MGPQPPVFPNGPDALFASLLSCWPGSGRPDEIEMNWRAKWAAVRDLDREVLKQTPAEQQRSFIDRYRLAAGRAADWAILRLSRCEPFEYWTEWQEDARIAGGPAVGQTDGKGYVLPLRVFVFPRGDRPAEDYSRQDPPFWPLGQAPTSAIRRVAGMLRCCLIRNLLTLTVEPLSLILLAVTAISLAGLAIWGSRSEGALDAFLVAGSCSSACLTFLIIWEVLREILLVWREGWFRTWKRSLIRIVCDPPVPSLAKGDSYDLAVAFASFSGLAENVLSRNGEIQYRSRFSKLMEWFRNNRAKYAATGRLAGPLGVLIGRVGGIEAKWCAVPVDMSQFLVPITFEDVRMKLGQLSGHTRKRARLRLRLFAPAAALKLAGVYRASALAATLLAAALLIPLKSEIGLMVRIYPPEFVGTARWWMRTGTRHDVNLLQLEFRGVRGDPSDYFVIVDGRTRDLAPVDAPSETSAPAIAVHGQAQLTREGANVGAAVANVSLRAAGGTPDPHRLSVVLFQRRSFPGLRLPPIKVSTFGLPDVEVEP